MYFPNYLNFPFLSTKRNINNGKLNRLTIIGEKGIFIMENLWHGIRLRIVL